MGTNISVGKWNLEPYQKDFNLKQNYPNPFNPITTIEYVLPHGGAQYDVSLCVYDLLGRTRTLINESQVAGSYSVQFDVSDLPSGIYFYQIKAQNYSETIKLVVLK